jgi:hypothetical protein
MTTTPMTDQLTRRVLYAEAARCPVYVTEAEWELLKAAFAPTRPDDPIWSSPYPPDPYSTLFGVPVVVDADKADEQDKVARQTVAERVTPDQILDPAQGAMIRARLALQRVLEGAAGRTNRAHYDPQTGRRFTGGC